MRQGSGGDKCVAHFHAVAKGKLAHQLPRLIRNGVVDFVDGKLQGFEHILKHRQFALITAKRHVFHVSDCRNRALLRTHDEISSG